LQCVSIHTAIRRLVLKAEKLRKFEYIFNPRTVAVIGASNGDGFSQALMGTKLRDNLFLVNPKHKELHGKRCYASILDIEGGIDYVVIAVPTLLVPKVLAECIEKGVLTAWGYVALNLAWLLFQMTQLRKVQLG
jgi:acyl-CoA synthetase (NDP forming)